MYPSLCLSRLTIDLKRGECDVSMVEIPESEGMGPNLITAWTNTDWGTFSSSGETISSCIGTTGQEAEADDVIEYKEDEQYEFIFTWDAVAGTAHASIQWGSDTLTLATGGGVMTPSTSGSGSDPITLVSGTSTQYTNLVVECRRIYGQ